MSGKIVGLVILISSLIAGGALYYLQVYGFYEEVTAEVEEVRLMPLGGGEPQPIRAEAIVAIDAESSPIRFRACFTTPSSLAMLTETYQGLDRAIPRNAPDWFDCFDAASIAAELQAGTALAFMGEKNVDFGVDRIVAITEDGRGYIWHELNDCGEKAYDGTIVGEECPRRPEAGQ
ncbi:MAG: DUF6446 family protein [Roseobacter sp.]|jgi:hypothetical protein|nr:DUF6446 family protein [Roseobacter sp.]